MDLKSIGLCPRRFKSYWCRFYIDTVAEWLRRWTANPLGSARVGSNPISIAFFDSMAEWSKATDSSSVLRMEAQVRTLLLSHFKVASVAQLGERQTEDLKVLCSNHSRGTLFEEGLLSPIRVVITHRGCYHP